MRESRGGLLYTSMGVPTTILFSLLRTFSVLSQKTSFDRIVLCWDISGSYYRRGLYPLYKKHRVHLDLKDYFAELDSVRDHFNILGFNQALLKGIEADDTIGLLSHQFKEQGHKVVIVSDDKDFFQSIRPGIKIFRPIMDEFISIEEVRDRYGMEPYELPRIKAITGEDTDFIPGVCDVDEKNMKLIKCGLGEKTAIKIVKGRLSLKEAIAKWEDAPKTKRPWKDILVSKQNMILKSYKLARIRTKMKMYLDWEKVLIQEMMKTILEERNPKLRTIIKLKNDLEIKQYNILTILNKLGIKVAGRTI